MTKESCGTLIYPLKVKPDTLKAELKDELMVLEATAAAAGAIPCLARQAFRCALHGILWVLWMCFARLQLARAAGGDYELAHHRC